MALECLLKRRKTMCVFCLPQINEAMCGIGVFIEASQNGLLTIKHVTPDGPASNMSEVHIYV